jgi:hypothetical protein
VFGGAEVLLQQELELQQQQQEAWQQDGGQQQQLLPSGLLCDVCVVLLALKRPAHPLWLAGMLEAYHRYAHVHCCCGLLFRCPL